MATIDLSIRDNMSAGAKAATDNLNKLADAADKATQSTTTMSETTSKVGPSFDSVNRKIDENANLLASAAAINKKYQTGISRSSR